MDVPESPIKITLTMISESREDMSLYVTVAGEGRKERLGIKEINTQFVEYNHPIE